MIFYFLRHAQSVDNVSKSAVEHDELSEDGLVQADGVYGRLRGIRFDSIVVSSKRRAIKTIIPYLKSARTTAEVWPEASEACWQEDRVVSCRPTERVGPLFTVAEEFKRWVVADKWARLPPDHETYGEGLERIKKLSERLLSSYGGGDDTVLNVGHYHAGSRLLEILLGQDPIGRYGHSNVGLTKLYQRKDGSFAVDFSNKTLP